MTPYTLILIAVLIISPFALNLAQKQNKKTKSRLRYVFLFLLATQIILGLLNWKALWLFLVISLSQILLLRKKHPLQTPAVILSFINTFVVFISMARSNYPASDPRNLTGIAITFIVLVGNVVGLLFINKEKNLNSNLFPARENSSFP